MLSGSASGSGLETLGNPPFDALSSIMKERYDRSEIKYIFLKKKIKMLLWDCKVLPLEQPSKREASFKPLGRHSRAVGKAALEGDLPKFVCAHRSILGSQPMS